MNCAANDDSALPLELRTERLLLTPLVTDDVDIILEMYTDPGVLKYACGAMTEPEIVEEMPNYTRRGGNGGIGNWCISDKGTGEKLGETYLLPLPIDQDHTNYSQVAMGLMPDARIEIGYFLKRSAWGRGYATEACRRLLRFAFEDVSLTEVVAAVSDENVASMRVLEKCGLIFCGRTRCHAKVSPMYRIRREDWDEMQRSADAGHLGFGIAASR